MAIEINLDNVQETLVSGTNIKTINSQSLLGSGDLEVGGAVDSVNGEVGVVVLDTDDINEGTTNEYYTEAKVSANTDVVANTAKNSYPSADATKLSGIEAGAEVNDTAAEIKTKYESNANTNAFTDAEKSKLANQSGTNTGDQDLSGLQATLVSGTNIKTINNSSILGSGNIGVVQSNTSGVSGADAITNLMSLTQAEYNAIGTPNLSTFYVITDA